MTDAEALTDAEIRTKLIEYGFPVMPITGTTRKVMVKKLKLLMEGGSSKKNDRRSLAQFSSEEESDTDSRVSKKERNRRATMAVVTPMQPPASVKVGVKKSARQDNGEVEKSVVREERTTRATKVIQNDLDTNSDSEPEIVESDYKSPLRNSGFERKELPRSTVTSSYEYTSSTRNYSPPRSTETYSPRSTEAVSPRSPPYLSPSPSRYSTYTASSDAAEKLNQIRSRLSLGSPSYTSTLDTTVEPTSSAQTPFLSNFTKRLSQLNKTELDVKADVKEHDANGAGYQSRSYLSRPKAREYGRSDYRIQDSGKGNYISFILVGGVIAFFIILALLYYGMHSGNNNNEIIGLVIPYCNKLDGRTESCILDTDLQGAIDIYKIIKPQLVKRAIACKCTDTNVKPYMTEGDIVEYIKSLTTQHNEFEILQDLNNFTILLFKNPFWDISVLQRQTTPFSNEDQVNDLSDVFENKRNRHKTAYAVLYPSLPFGCNLYLKLASAVKTSAIVLIVAAVLWSLRKGHKLYQHYKQSKRDEVVLMVEKIIDVLQLNASDTADNFLVVNHVRDMILPIENRKNVEKTWNKAVSFINENESRVRTEVQVVKGEPYEVWRWLGSLNTSPARNKSWQGQAFEMQAGSANTPPCSPTACLKIRGMVDDGDRHNQRAIRDAVLAKCVDAGAAVVHCAVDLHSKCVYLRCSDQQDAALAYRNLHGWWYASHLVTVKYLRSERYMQRFPDSPANGPPFLKPSQPVK